MPPGFRSMGEVAHGAMGRKQEVRDMKRLRRWLGIALAVLCVAGGCAAALADGGTAETVPAAIADALSGGRWEGYRIATSSVTGRQLGTTTRTAGSARRW